MKKIKLTSLSIILLALSGCTRDEEKPIDSYTFPLYEWCQNELLSFKTYGLKVDESFARFEIKERLFDGGPKPAKNRHGLIGYVEVKAWGKPEYGREFIEPAVNTVFSNCHPETIISFTSKTTENDILETIKHLYPTYNISSPRLYRITGEEIHVHYIRPSR